jgi:hypothetical protein
MTVEAKKAALRAAASLPPAPPAECEHRERVLLTAQCSDGSLQVRRWCTACWRSVEGPISHKRAREEFGGELPPTVQLGQLHGAQRALRRRSG